MNIVHKLALDLQMPVGGKIYVKQGDTMTRSVILSLYDGGTAFNTANAGIFQIVFLKPDKTGGVYDTMPDNTTACTVEGNEVTAKLHPQMFTSPGCVQCELRMINEDGSKILSSFSWIIYVEASAESCIKSESYYRFASIASLAATIGDLSLLNTASKDSLVEAVNDILRDVGKTASLTTGDVQMVTAMNRVVSWINQVFECDLVSNLINPAEIEESTLLVYSTGALATGSSYSSYITTGLIPARPGQVLRIQMETAAGRSDASSFETLSASNSMAAVCAYSAAHRYISGDRNVATFVIPDEAAYIRVSLYESTQYTQKMIFYSDESTVLPYVEYKQANFHSIRPELVPVDKLDLSSLIMQGPGESANKAISQASLSKLFECDYTLNLLDLEKVVAFSLLSYTNGKLNTGSAYSGYWTTGYIPCSPGDIIRLQLTAADTGIRHDATELSDSASRMTAVCAYSTSHTYLAGASKAASFTVPAGAAYVRISLVKTVSYYDYKIFVSDNADVKPYSAYGETTFLGLRPEYLPAAKPLVFLPDEICVAVGRTIEIYNAQVCPCAKRYHFRWICNVGKALQRKFSVEGTEGLIGEYELRLEIYDDDLNLVDHASSTVKIVAAELTNEVQLCTIGDSLTNGKYWLQELRTLSENKIVHVGTRGSVTGLMHEGRSGFKASGYLSAQSYDFEDEGVHPFWDPETAAFSWAYYKANSGINPSAVQIFLGTNDLAGGAEPETVAEDIAEIVSAIRSDDSEIPIFVVATICWGDQDGIGRQTSSDGFASQKGRWKYHLDHHTISLAKALQDQIQDVTGVYFVPLTECHDSTYNFGAVATPVNPRAIQTELMPVEGVHPQQQGYEQMADVMWSVICAKLGGDG